MATALTPMMALSEAAASMPGPTRKPGNLWTVEAREDMFSRRESGEGWETICQDYPNRSRHAMQQQYSMMKKQRALESGTWNVGRRGRKRRLLSPERMRDDAEISDEEMDDASPHRSHTMRLPSLSQLVGRQQPPFYRSTTNPIFQRHLPNINSSGPPTSDASSSLSPIPAMSSPEFRRHRFGNDRPESSQMFRPRNPWYQEPIPELALTEDDLKALIQKGRDQATQIIEDMNHQKETMRQGKDDQISKYVAQLREAQDQLALERGQGPYAQELNRRDKDVESLRSHVTILQETLLARDTKIMHLEKEIADLKIRCTEYAKREEAIKTAGTNSPPTTPVARRRSSPSSFISWEEAAKELSDKIDSASGHITTMRGGLDSSSISQIFQSINELDAVMGAVVKDRDRVMLAFGRLMAKEEAISS